MKPWAFVLGYGAPLTLGFIVAAVALEGFSLRLFGALVPGLFLSMLGLSGLLMFGPRKLYEGKTERAILVRGLFAGVIWIALSAAAGWLFGWRTAFWIVFGLAFGLPPIALFLPPLRRVRATKEPGPSLPPRDV